jgi:hypothetical protein
MLSDAERIKASYGLYRQVLSPDEIRNEAAKLRAEIANLRSYTPSARRDRVRRRVLAVVHEACPTAPFELIALVADVLEVTEGEPQPGSLRYGRAKGDAFISAMMYEKRYIQQHGRVAPCNRVAEAVDVDWNTIREWRTDPDYLMIAFGGNPPA